MKRLQFVLILIAALSALSVLAVHAQQAEPEVVIESGVIDNQESEKEYVIALQAGESILILVEATSGNLDSTVSLYDPNDTLVGFNDDRVAGEVLDSVLGHTAALTGDYRIVVSRWDGGESSGSFELTITIGDTSVLEPLEDLTARVELSGAVQTLDTENFRIHYTTEGADRTDDDYVQATALAVEEFLRIEVDEMGFPAPPRDAGRGGDDRIDVYLADIFGEGVFGYINADHFVGDNPNSPEIETTASAGYMVIDNDFDSPGVNRTTAIGYMRTTIAHEFHHLVQFGMDGTDSHSWLYEATASWIETSAARKDEEATFYVSHNFNNPDICLGYEGDADLWYGEWPFLQFLVDEYGDSAVVDLWRNMISADGFDALQATIAPFNDTIPAAVARYRIANLARDYEYAPDFDATVAIDDIITRTGRWTHDTDEGVQELGANYFAFEMPPGVYYAGLMNDNTELEVWAVGVTADEVEAIPLRRGGDFDTTRFEYTYLMVFNPNYDNDVSDCRDYSYELDVTPAKGIPNAAAYRWSAEHFEPLN